MNTSGLIKEMYLLATKSELCKKLPNNDNETKAADPIAKSFPIATVVLSVASRQSVLYLTYAPI